MQGVNGYKETVQQLEFELEAAQKRIQEGDDIEFAMGAVLDAAKEKLETLRNQNSKLSMELEVCQGIHTSEFHR